MRNDSHKQFQILTNHTFSSISRKHFLLLTKATNRTKFYPKHYLEYNFAYYISKFQHLDMRTSLQVAKYLN